MKTLKYGSVCSGVEAASVAWHSLGWTPSWFAEIEKFPSAVLAHRFPSVPNLGDMTKIADGIREGTIEAPDLLVGGTPCQAYSLAGHRKGLNDPRGRLTLEYVRILDAMDEQNNNQSFALWENVPGVLSDKTNACGNLMSALAGGDEAIDCPVEGWPSAGFVDGPKRNVAWCVLDAQYFGVPARRRRIFVLTTPKQYNPANILQLGLSVKNPHRDIVGKQQIDDVYAIQLGYFARTGRIPTFELAPTILANECMNPVSVMVNRNGKKVLRRMIPNEYERLQGFPDDWTNIQFPGKPNVVDTRRIKTMGNSMAVPVMKWLGEQVHKTINGQITPTFFQTL